jgi:hypothetical protein
MDNLILFLHQNIDTLVLDSQTPIFHLYPILAAVAAHMILPLKKGEAPKCRIPPAQCEIVINSQSYFLIVITWWN